MSLAPGTRLGPYEILGVAGQGGMGAVYQARDTRLDRTVALKTLHPGRAVTAEMRQRFQAEARAISRLNHPHVCTLHDVGRDSDIDYLVLEFVDAKSLDRLIPKGGMRLNEVLSLGWQIADAVAAAHKAGIVHRDLKPGNVMVNERGQVKVLDFGLAKLDEITRIAHSAAADDATLTNVLDTTEGTVLGTVAYMSPEQAEGKPVDARSDIFSFGVLLYEMATGRRPFTGDSRMAIIAAILNQEPAPLGEEMPPEFRRLVERCLRKALDRRMQHMDDARVVLQDLKEDSASGAAAAAVAVSTRVPDTSRRRSSTVMRWAGAALLGAAMLAAGVWAFRTGFGDAATVPAGPLKVTPLTSLPGGESSPSFSPDGSQVAFAWSGGGDPNGRGIYVKTIGSEKPLRLTSGRDVFPAWSPNGRWIAFSRFSSGKVAYLVVAPTGGPERTLAETLTAGRPFPLSRAMASCWTPDSKALIISEGYGVGKPVHLSYLLVDSLQRTRLTNPPADVGGDLGPAVSPDGSMVAFSRLRSFGEADIHVMGMEGARVTAEPRPLTTAPGQFTGPVVLSDSGGLIFHALESRLGTGLQRLSLHSRSEMTSLGLPDAEHAGISRDGRRLAFGRGAFIVARMMRLTLENGQGKVATPFAASTRMEQQPVYSSDGTRVAFESDRTGNRELWVTDANGENAVQLTSFGGPHTTFGRWSPDGKQLAFLSTASGTRDLYLVNADGGASRIIARDSLRLISGWSADGKWIYGFYDRAPGLWKVPAGGGERVSVPGGVAGRPSSDGKAWISWADGRLSYQPWADEKPAGTTKIIQAPGAAAAALSWADGKDGLYFFFRRSREIFYWNYATGRVTLAWTSADPLGLGLSLSPDGKTLLYSVEPPTSGTMDLALVENFR